MAKQINRLTALGVDKKKKHGYHADGAGLYLQVSRSGGKSWVFRYTRQGKAREMGLGSFLGVSLEEARNKRDATHKQLAEGIDPIEARDARMQAQAVEQARGLTFDQCAEAYIEAHRAGWKNAKHAAQWTATLDTYASPVFGALPVQAIDTALVTKALEPIWRVKPETASRLRGRIESVLAWATVRGYRAGDNPARWRGHLAELLPARNDVKKVEHHAALPYSEIGAFVATLRKQEGIAALALEFTILTATRTGEVIGARWEEFDLSEKVWTIPADRMKAKREHRVPLPPRAVELVKELQDKKQNDFVFPGARPKKPVSNMAMLELLKRMERTDLTVHGFRSTFRDWAAECTNFPNIVSEAALAHTVSDKVEAAYRRGDLFDKRRRLMLEWAKYCETAKASGKVIPIRGKAA